MKKFEIKKTNYEFSTLILNKNGSAVDVCYIFQAEVVISCNAEFADFPFHQHACSLEIGSFTKTVNRLLFLPDHKYQPETQVELKSSDYDISVSYLKDIEEIKQGIKNVSEDYCVVGVKLELRNRWRKYIVLYYVPTTLIVVTSWVFFLLPSTSYPAWTALLVTVFLLLINIFSNIVNETPDSSDGGKILLSFSLQNCHSPTTTST